jgi:hypothetical protein
MIYRSVSSWVILLLRRTWTFQLNCFESKKMSDNRNIYQIQCKKINFAQLSIHRSVGDKY